jgi:hypothetical protein
MQVPISPSATGSTSVQASSAPALQVEKREAPQQNYLPDASVQPRIGRGADGHDVVHSRLRASTRALEQMAKEEARARECGDATVDADRMPEESATAARRDTSHAEHTAGMARAEAEQARVDAHELLAAERVARRHAESAARQYEGRAAEAVAAVVAVRAELLAVEVELARSQEDGNAMQRAAQSALAAAEQAEAWRAQLTRERDGAFSRADADTAKARRAAEAEAAARNDAAGAREALEAERRCRAVVEASLLRVQAEAAQEAAALHAALRATADETARVAEEAARLLRVASAVAEAEAETRRAAAVELAAAHSARMQVYWQGKASPHTKHAPNLVVSPAQPGPHGFG